MGDGSNAAGYILMETGDRILLEDGSGSLRIDDDVYGPLVVADGAIAYWRLGEASGNPQDSIGANDVDTVSGSPTYGVRGAVIDTNTSMKFTGSDVYAKVTTPVTPLTTLGDGPLSIEFWYRNALTTTDVLNTAAFRTNWAVDFNGTEIRFRNVANVAMVTANNPGGNIWDLDWHHVVVTRSAAGTGNTKIYLDVVDATIEGSQIGATLPTISNAIHLGSFASESAQIVLDEVAIYAAVLTSTQVLNHYLAGRPLRNLPRSPYPQALPH